MEPKFKPSKKSSSRTPMAGESSGGDSSQHNAIDRLSVVFDRIYGPDYRAARRLIHKRLRQKNMGSPGKKPPPQRDDSLYQRIMAFRHKGTPGTSPQPAGGETPPQSQSRRPSNARRPSNSSSTPQRQSPQANKTPQRTPPQSNRPSRPQSRKAKKYQPSSEPPASDYNDKNKTPYDRGGSKSSFESVDLPPFDDDDEENKNPTPKPTKTEHAYVSRPGSSQNRNYRKKAEPAKVRQRSQSVSSISGQKHEFTGSYVSKLEPGYTNIPAIVSTNSQHGNYVYLSRSKSDPDLWLNKSDTESEESRGHMDKSGDLRKRLRKKRNRRSANDLDLAQKVFLRRRVMAFVDKSEEPTTARDVYVEMGDEGQDSPKRMSRNQSRQDDLPPVREATPRRGDRPLSRAASDLNKHTVVPPITKEDGSKNSRNNTPDQRQSSRPSSNQNRTPSRNNTPSSDDARATILSPRNPPEPVTPSSKAEDQPIERAGPSNVHSSRPEPNKDDIPEDDQDDDEDSPVPVVPARTPKVRKEDGRIAALEKLADYNLKTLAGQDAGEAPEIDDKIMNEVFSPEFQKDLDNFLKS